MSLPGADVLVPQESKLSFSVGCWRAVPHGNIQSSPKCVGIGGSEVACMEVLAVMWLAASARTNDQNMAVKAIVQLSKVSLSRKLDLFETTSKILRIPRAIEEIWARQRLMLVSVQ